MFYSYHTQTAHIYIMEQFSADIYALINKINNVVCVCDKS